MKKQSIINPKNYSLATTRVSRAFQLSSDAPPNSSL